jgi:hypothetical protein
MMTPFRTLRQRRRDALAQDALLFCTAFTVGAALYVLGRAVVGVFRDSVDSDFWSIGLSDNLILSGLIAGELFLIWNNGVRQGLRGHSIGKHRVGIAVVDVGDDAPIGPWRGLLRGTLTAVLLDLAVAAIPIGLPTVLRRLTPESWHVGGAAYVALILLLVPLLIPSERGFADLIARSKVVPGSGAEAVTDPGRRRALVLLDAVGVLGVLGVAASYVSFFWPLIWHFPGLL